MPKYRKKNRPAKSGDDDCASVDDGVSTCSNISDLTSIYDDSEVGFSANNDVLITSDNLDEKLDTAIEGLRNKDLKTREHSLHALQTLLSKKYLYDLLLENRSVNLLEQLLSSIRKGNESEGKLLSIVTSLFVIQLGEPNDELYIQIRDVIMPILRDESKPSLLRKNYAKTMGIVCFVACEDISMTIELMDILEKIFSRSYLRGDGMPPILSQDVQELHAAVLASWCLLASVMPSTRAHELIRLYALEKIPGLIESSNSDLRNQAGETVAVLFEIARDIDSIFATDPPTELLELLERKANESSKFKGKKERRIQHATFREIYNSFEEGTSPQFDIKFGRETLEITSWTSRLHYNTFSNILAAGMNAHLKENEFLRSIFNLDDIIMDDTPQAKGKRFERQIANKAAFKVRTQALNKNRANKTQRSQYQD